MLRMKQAVVLAGLMGAFATAHAIDSRDDLALGTGGSFACNGANFSSTDYTSWGFRNFNEAATITIDRIRIFDAEGVLLWDSNVSAYPTGFKTTLNAHQSTGLSSIAVLGTTSFASPLQMHVDWSSVEGARVLALNPGWFRVSAGINGSCRMTSLRTR